MARSVCIVCGKPKFGLKVERDHVIEAISWIKRNVTKNEMRSDLVVCKECFLKYKKERESYIRRQIIYVALGIVFTIALASLSGAKAPFAIIYGLFLTLLLYLLSLLSYVPSVNIPKIKRQDQQ